MFSKTQWAAVAILLVTCFRPLVSRAEEYAATLIAEMSAGKTKVFSSGTITNKGAATFEISYPKTWQVKESPRPHILVRISDTDHPRTGIFVIGENRSSKPATASPDQVFTKAFFENYKVTNSVVLHGERFKEGAFDGALVEYIAQPAADPFRLFASDYIFLQKGSMVHLQFYVTLPANEDKQADEAKIASYKPLWKAMLATLKLQP